MRNRRLTVVGNPPPYLFWGESKETDAAKIFRALGIVVCCEDSKSVAETRRVAGGFLGVRGKGIWVEREERKWMYFKIVSC